MRLRRHVIAALVAPALAAPLLAQRVTDRFRGRVTADSGPVAGAVITITRAPDRAIRRDTTDADGRWAITIDDGTGDYLVAADALGFRTVRRRVTRATTETSFTVDFFLARDVTTLAAVQVRETPPQRAPRRTASPTAPEPGATERWSEGVVGQLAPTVLGDPDALAGTTPGLVVTAGGAALLDAPSSSNLVTLNGLALAPGTTLPRAARTAARVTSTSWDATRGGFAGANVDLLLAAGDRDFQNRRGWLTSEPGATALADDIARATGAAPTTTRLSAGADGELVRRALTYNVTADATRTTAAPATLASADAAALTAIGTTPGAVAALREASARAGVPFDPAGTAALRQRDAATLLARIDLTTDTLRTLAVTTLLADATDGGVGLSPAGVASAARTRRDGTLAAQLVWNDFVGPGRRALSQLRVGATRVTSRTDAALALPAATVLLSDSARPADATLVTLGGTAAPLGPRTATTLELAHDLTTLVRGARHRLKVGSWLRTDALDDASVADGAGTFGYATTTDLALGRPARYTRTLARPALVARTWNVAGAVSHQWSPARTLSVLSGLRVEGNLSGTALAANPALDAALGVRSGLAPTTWTLNPRIGMSWTYTRRRNAGGGQFNNEIGQFYRPPIGTLRGGIGRFRDLLLPGALADAGAATGLPGSTVRLSCVGAAVPIPDWTALAADPASAPATCRDGTGPLVEQAPSAVVLAPGFQPAGRWTASLGWTSAVGPWLLRADALASLAEHQPSRLDANFAARSPFALAGEAGRPMWVPASAIDAASGAVSPASSRVSDAYGRVDLLTGDLRARSAQLTVSLAPDIVATQGNAGRLGTVYGALAYTLQGVRQQFRGSDGAGFGDPRRVEWAPGANDARHVVLLQGGLSNAVVGTLTIFARVQSGLPFTPVVAGDVDGDGRANDRAVIPGAAQLADASVRAAWESLRAATSAGARTCLDAHVGLTVPRHACRGPWTVTTNLQWQPRLPWRRVRVAVNVANLAAGLDRLLHGTADLRGWGQPAALDPVLLVPRGYDVAAERFRYAVNPTFGMTRPARTLLRDPFRVALDVSLDFSTPYAVQQLRRAVEPVRNAGGWQPQTARMIAARYLARTSSLPRAILAESDSLLLTPAQVLALRAADSAFTTAVRAIYGALGDSLARASATGPPGARQVALANEATTAYERVFWAQVDSAVVLLTPVQRTLMPLVQTLASQPPSARPGSRWTFGFAVRPEDER